MGFVVTVAFAAQAGVGDGYEHAMQIAFTGYTNEVALTNFPALIVLSEGTAGFSYGDMHSTNADLRFAYGDGTELSYEIDQWKPASQSFVWVKLPLLASNTVITCFWSQAGITIPSYSLDGSTWSEGFVSVHHFGTNAYPALAPDYYNDDVWVLDSVANNGGGDHGYWGYTYGNGPGGYMDLTDWMPGKIGQCLAFNTDGGELGAGTEYILLEKKDGYQTFANGITMSLWVKIAAYDAGGWTPFMDLHDIASGGNNNIWWGATGSPWSSEVDFYNGTGDTLSYFYDNGAYAIGQWAYVTYTVTKDAPDNCVGNTYMNGEPSAAFPGINMPSEVVRDECWFASDGWGEWLYGSMDELQVSAVVRSPEWVWASYRNQNNPATFAAYTPAEVPEPGAAAAAVVAIGCSLFAVWRRGREK